ncbi:MAG: hypothetical protein V4697_03840 [Patescibacteria group bacterium]
MSSPIQTRGGSAGILILFIGAVILMFLMFKQYEKLGMLKVKGEPYEVSPVDQAQAAKDALESRNRETFGQ